MGTLILAPVIYVALERPDVPLTRRRLLEATVLLAALLFLSLSIFAVAPALGPSLPLEPYALFPLLIWATLRFGPHGAREDQLEFRSERDLLPRLGKHRARPGRIAGQGQHDLMAHADG